MENRVQPPPPPVVIEGDKEYKIEAIVASQKHYRKTQYLIKWTGYPLDKKNNWIAEDGLCHAKDILNKFLENDENLPPAKRHHRK